MKWCLSLSKFGNRGEGRSPVSQSGVEGRSPRENLTQNMRSLMKSLLREMTFCGISTSRTGCFLAWIFLTKMTEWRKKAANVLYLTCERATVELSENNANFIAKVLILLKSNDFIAQRAQMPTGIARSAKKIWLKVPNFRSARLSCGFRIF